MDDKERKIVEWISFLRGLQKTDKERYVQYETTIFLLELHLSEMDSSNTFALIIMYVLMGVPLIAIILLIIEMVKSVLGFG